MPDVLLSMSETRLLANGLQQTWVARPMEERALEDALLRRRALLVSLWGPGGSGKTSLAHMFINRYRDQFPGGIRYQYANHPDFWNDDQPYDPELRNLLVIDECDSRSDVFHRVAGSHAFESNTSILLISRARPPDLNGLLAEVPVGPLSAAQTLELLKAIGVGEGHAKVFSQLIDGNLALAQLLEGLLAKRTPREILEEIHNYRRVGLVDVTGRPLSGRSSQGSRLITDARTVDRALLTEIGRKPELVHELDPRKFEEFCADLFRELGYRVELTPKSKDGGRDLHVARNDALGSLLYYVECKRYAPHNTVGVALVRQLYGTVQAGRATAGMLLTTSRFSKGARSFQATVEHQLSLADYVRLQALLGEAGYRPVGHD